MVRLERGKIRFEYGPVSMILCAWKNEEPQEKLLKAACEAIAEQLGELSRQLVLLKQPWVQTKISDFYGLSAIMRQAVEKTGDVHFTPMAAVAGTMAEFAVDFLEKGGATKAFVNNGGDIALRIPKKDRIRVGVVSSLETGQISRVLEVKGADGIGGICTSGLGGRSFTTGIADAVTVLAESCPIADAFATFLANQTYISSSAVEQEKAGLLDPQSDIAALDVTRRVGPLKKEEIESAFSQLKKKAYPAISAGKIQRVYGYIQGEEWIYPDC